MDELIDASGPMQWETNILLKNRHVPHPWPFGHPVKYLNLLGHRSCFARSLPGDLLRFARKLRFWRKGQFQHRKRRCIYIRERMILDIFLWRNREIQYDSNTAGQRLCYIFIKFPGSKEFTRNQKKNKGKEPGLAAPRRSLQDEDWTEDWKKAAEWRSGLQQKDENTKDRHTAKKSKTENKMRKKAKEKTAHKERREHRTKQIKHRVDMKTHIFGNPINILSGNYFPPKRKVNHDAFATKAKKSQRRTKHVFRVRWQVEAGERGDWVQDFRAGTFLNFHFPLSLGIASKQFSK